MRRGHGRIQQAIAALIANEPDGAWTTTQLCQHIYGSAERKHPQAVSRAIRNMRLPFELGKVCWTIKKTYNEHCLVNDCSVESTLRHLYLAHGVSCSFDRWKDDWSHILERVRKEVQDRVAHQIRYRDASPVDKLDMNIARVKKSMAFFKMFGLNSKTIARIARHLSELLQQKAELEAGLDQPARTLRRDFISS